MKKRISFLLAVIMILAVMVPAMPVMANAPTDSFSLANYDAETNFTISTPKDLKDFYAAVYVDGKDFAGKTVSLTHNIPFNAVTDIANWGTTAPTNTLAGTAAADNSFKGTFDGANFTITGLYTVDAPNNTTTSGVGLFPRVEGQVTIKNLTIDGFYVAGETGLAANVGTLVGYAHACKLRLENCTLRNGTVSGDTDDLVGGAVGHMNRTHSDNQHIVFVSLNIEPTVTVSGTTAGGIMGKLVCGNLNGQGNNYPMFNVATSRINPANATSTLNPLGAVDVNVSGGYFWWFNDEEVSSNTKDTEVKTSDVTLFNAAIKSLGCYGPAPEPVDPNNTFDVSTYSSATEFVLTTKQDFVAFYKFLNGGNDFDGKTVKLAGDIILNEVTTGDWYTSATTKLGELASAMYFRGTFDGQNNSIFGAVVVGDNGHWAGGVGLFGCAQYATIKNLTLDGFYMSNPTTGGDNSSTGAIVGYADKEVYIDNCTVKNGTLTAVTADAVSIGGLIGKIEANTPNEGKTTGNLQITRTVIEPTVVITPPTATTLNAGGVIGWYNRDARQSHDYMDVSESRFQPTATNLPAIGFFKPGHETVYTLYLTHGNNYEGFEAYTNIRQNNDNVQTELAASFAPVYGDTYAAPRVTFAGVQTNADGDVRFVGIVNGHEDFDVAGFILTVGDEEVAFETTKAYDSLVAGGETVAPAGEGKYFTFVLTDVPADTTFSIRAYSSIVNPAYVDRYVSATYTYTYAPAVS